MLAAGVLTALLAYFMIPQVLAATPSAGFHTSLPVEQQQSWVILLSNPLTAGLFWFGLLFGEFSSGVIALKLLGRWKSRNNPEPVQDNNAEIQSLFDDFLGDL